MLTSQVKVSGLATFKAEVYMRANVSFYTYNINCLCWCNGSRNCYLYWPGQGVESMLSLAPAVWFRMGCWAERSTEHESVQKFGFCMAWIETSTENLLNKCFDVENSLSSGHQDPWFWMKSSFCHTLTLLQTSDLVTSSTPAVRSQTL